MSAEEEKDPYALPKTAEERAVFEAKLAKIMADVDDEDDDLDPVTRARLEARADALLDEDDSDDDLVQSLKYHQKIVDKQQTAKTAEFEELTGMKQSLQQQLSEIRAAQSAREGTGTSTDWRDAEFRELEDLKQQLLMQPAMGEVEQLTAELDEAMSDLSSQLGTVTEKLHQAHADKVKLEKELQSFGGES